MKVKIKIYTEYLGYLLSHKYLVAKMLIQRKLWLLALVHDLSKFRPDEFSKYARYYATNKRMPIEDAWHRHLHRNKHHWQYWLFIDNEGNMKAFEMPEKYVIEMIADWYAVAIMEGGYNKLEQRVAEWYFSRQNKILLHQNTKKFVEDNISVYVEE